VTIYTIIMITLIYAFVAVIHYFITIFATIYNVVIPFVAILLQESFLGKSSFRIISIKSHRII